MILKKIYFNYTYFWFYVISSKNQQYRSMPPDFDNESMIKKDLTVCLNIIVGSSAVDGKMFLESNASSIQGTYFRLG